MIAHDVAAQLGQITVPTQITFGRHDLVTSTRFADQIRGAMVSEAVRRHPHRRVPNFRDTAATLSAF